MGSPDPSFGRAFVATLCVLGERGDALLTLAPAEARDLAEALSKEDRERRAALLARELLRVARALDEGALS